MVEYKIYDTKQHCYKVTAIVMSFSAVRKHTKDTTNHVFEGKF